MKKVKVTALKAFPLDGAIVGPGEVEVPEEKVARLIEKKIIEPPSGAEKVAADDGKIEAAVTRIARSLSLQSNPDESVETYLERAADVIESNVARAEREKLQSKEGQGGPASDELPAAFPTRDRLKAAGITTYSHLAKATDEQLLKVHGVNAAQVKEIRAAENARAK